MTKKALKAARLVSLLVGLFIINGIIHKIGWHSILEQLRQLHGWIWPILGLGIFWNLGGTLAWRKVLNLQNCPIPFWRLLRTKIAGEAMNTMTPINFLGGDPLRIYMLRHSSPLTDVAASVVVDRMLQSVAIVIAIFIGASFAILLIPGLPLTVTFGMILFLLLTTGLIFFFFLRQKRGLFQSILELAKRLKIFPKKAEHHLPHAILLDKNIVQIYQNSHTAFWEILALHVAGRLFGVVEIYWVGKIVDPQFPLLVALLLATVAPIINMMFTFIPGALGVLEGTYTGLLYLLGLNPALGITIQIVKRIRSLLWIGLGVLFISLPYHQTSAPHADPSPLPR